ncbi:MAG: GNAT family N-acetyltransferase [Pseudomonadota bacterium]
MSLREAMPEDAGAIEAFLAQHPTTSLFLRSNLARFGPCGGEGSHATKMWLAERDGAIRAVYGISSFGMAMLQAPALDSLPAFAAAVEGQALAGVTGDPSQVDTLRRTLGLEDARTRHDEAEPLYDLPLDQLRIPDGTTRLIRARDRDFETLCAWRLRYHVDLFGAPADEAAVTAKGDIERMVEEDRLRVLVDAAGTPMAKTGFNATLPDIVQIGYVYTPPTQRSQGHARRAVALHLAEAREAGVSRAILFAANEPACRAYEAIGFERIGDYTILLFDGKQTIAKGLT